MIGVADVWQFNVPSSIMCWMELNTAIKTLRQHKDAIRARGVAHLFVFGSVARNEAMASSDVDIFFDYDDPRFSLIELAEAKSYITEIMGRPADIMTRGSLHPKLRANIETSAIQIF